GVVEINVERREVFVKKTQRAAVRQQLKDGGRTDDAFARDFFEQVQVRTQALVDRIAVEQRGERIHRAFVRRAEHKNLVDVARTGPSDLRGFVVCGQIGVAI